MLRQMIVGQTDIPLEATRTDDASSLRRMLVALPTLVMVLVYLWAAAHTAKARLLRPWTQSPWESEIVMDAWRVVHHQPVYTDPALDHATHMYGPLGTYIVAPFIKKYGADPRIPRFIALLAALTLCVLMSMTLSHRSGSWWLTAAMIFALSYLQFYRIREWATEARPDATALLCGFIAIVFFYRAACAISLRNVWTWSTLGAVATLVTFFFKQPVAMVALLPPLMLVFNQTREIARRIAPAVLPLAALAGAIALLKLLAPWVYHYMVAVPGMYPVSPGTWFLALLELLRFNTLFVATLFAWIALRSGSEQSDPIDRWLIATILISGLVGSAARAKFGGYFNSLLPTYLAMSVFVARKLPALLRSVASQNPPVVVLFAILPALLLLADIVAPAGGRTLNPGAIALQHGDASFTTIIKAAKSLPGKFVSPDDPLIALNAKAYAGRCEECELDAIGRNSTEFPLPQYMLDELRDADWVLQVSAARPSTIPDDTLSQMGFQKTSGIIPRTAVYTLWKHASPSI
jgi:hypothetical protein